MLAAYMIAAAFGQTQKREKRLRSLETEQVTLFLQQSNMSALVS
jgi:hypothetical protein